jgi:hypothetical protein
MRIAEKIYVGAMAHHGYLWRFDLPGNRLTAVSSALVEERGDL